MKGLIVVNDVATGLHQDSWENASLYVLQMDLRLSMNSPTLAIWLSPTAAETLLR
jgi:hypothetical protein